MGQADVSLQRASGMGPLWGQASACPFLPLIPRNVKRHLVLGRRDVVLPLLVALHCPVVVFHLVHARLLSARRTAPPRSNRPARWWPTRRSKSPSSLHRSSRCRLRADAWSRCSRASPHRIPPAAVANTPSCPERRTGAPARTSSS